MLQLSKSVSVMEAETISKNEANPKSLMSRGKWKLLALFVLLIFSSCKEEELPEYIVIDENLGDQIDYAILGRDGFGYFYEFQDAKPNIPKRFTIYDGNQNKVELVVNFDENGLPKNILSEDFTVVLGKYEGSSFSAVVIIKEGESQMFENIETDLNWDDYKNDLISGRISETSEPMIVTRSILDDFDKAIIKPVAKMANHAINAVGCGTYLAALATPAAPIVAPLAFISCGKFGLELGDELGLWKLPQIYHDGSFLKDFMGLASCGSNYWECFTSIAGLVSYEGEAITNSKRESIALGEIILLQTGDGNVTHTGGSGVYVAGYERNAQNITVAKLWKNGVVQNLTDGTCDAQAHSVYVSGNNVYVAGQERNTQNSNYYIAKLWINGVVQNLTDGTIPAQASSVYVSGNDVYVAGSGLWKNGVVQNFTDGSNSAYASSVLVSGSDVYVAGSVYDGSQSRAVLWKNGVAQNLSGTYALSVFVLGSDVYVVGYDSFGPSARLWKNGVQQFRPLNAFYFDNQNSYAEARSIYISGSDVYVAGYLGRPSVAVLWKNGVQQNLTNEFSFARSVYISGSDIYVAGEIGYQYAVLWINGIALGLTDGTREARAESVFVVP